MQVIGAGDDKRFLMGYIWQNIPQDLGEVIFIQSTNKTIYRLVLFPEVAHRL